MSALSSSAWRNSFVAVQIALRLHGLIPRKRIHVDCLGNGRDSVCVGGTDFDSSLGVFSVSWLAEIRSAVAFSDSLVRASVMIDLLCARY